ncbi:hypothetical protein OGM63_21375 [Plectonema radiosum NIES-515]|uniref:Uncharacterized protein n=1 Tax=Plectonema radiosum NIES-515 TaxID=2986073 RepID=A0ABT3B3T3_9CYAN|nr:hypothetical protein [Plectonema radiosum]MCV3216029.1 hypothetical protein [Plectonema radiosum NIES-515]
MVRQRFQDYFFTETNPFIPKNNPNLKPPTGSVPLFNNPFTKQPIFPAIKASTDIKFQDLEFGGEPTHFEYQQDQCGFVIRAFGGHGGIIGKFDVSLSYRDPACHPALPEPPDPPVPNVNIEKPSQFPLKESNAKSLCITYREIYNSYNEGTGIGGTGIEASKRKIKLIEAQYPYTGDYKDDYRGKPEGYALFQVTASYTADGYAIGYLKQKDIDAWKERGWTISGDPYDGNSQWKIIENQKLTFYKFNTKWKIVFEKNEFLYPGISGYFQFYEDFMEDIKNSRDIFSIDVVEKQGFTRDKSNFPLYIPSLFYPRTVEIIGEVNDFYGVNYIYNKKRIYALETAMKYAVIFGNFRAPEIQTPPPPPPPMSCCPNVQQNDQLLKLILKKIGSTHLPATVPKVLTDQKKGTIKVESLTEFIAYTIKQMDALCGRYPIDIEIEDADLTKEGNQTKKLKLPNVAETLAEIMGLLLVLRSESDATLNATIRALTEAGSSKQMAFLAYEYAKANAEFLGYKGEQIERKIPFAFKPGESRLDKMLQEGEISVRGWENEDKDDFNDLIAPLLELAAMWKVANFRKIGTADPKESIKNFLQNAAKFSETIDAGILLEKIKKYKAQDDKDKDPKDLADEWDKFVEEVEKGFISQPGVIDKEKPYGKPLDERPKIRDISKDTSK